MVEETDEDEDDEENYQISMGWFRFYYFGNKRTLW